MASVRLHREPIGNSMAYFANLSKWETILSSGKPEAVAMTQAGVIGQTFGMLSGVRGFFQGYNLGFTR